MPEPSKVRAGLTAKWERQIDDYDAASWSAEYSLHAEGLTSIAVPTTGSGNEYSVNVPPTTTSTWAPGLYHYILTVTDGTDVFEIDSGSIEILSETASGNDLMDAKAVLAKAEAEYEERITGKASSYSIKDRSLTRMDADELRQAIGYWRRRVQALQETENRRKGKPSNRITYARF